MDHAIATLIPLFKANNYLFEQALKDIPTEDLHRRPHDNSNPMIWIAGHATWSRGSLTRMVGGHVENPWSKLFERGVTVDETVSYPDISEIITLWKNVTNTLIPRLKELTTEELDADCKFPLPTSDKSQRGAVFFLNFHETYHIGQLAYVRKWLGHSQLVG